MNEVQPLIIKLLWDGEQRGLGGLPHERLRDILPVLMYLAKIKYAVFHQIFGNLALHPVSTLLLFFQTQHGRQVRFFLK